MKLSINLPEVKVKHPNTGAVLATIAPISVTTVQLILCDSEAIVVNGKTVQRARVTAQLRPIPHRPLVLWEGDSYVSAGDWTGAQAEARVLELLGSDPAKVLVSLMQPPAK